MENLPHNGDYMLIYVVVNLGQGSKVLHIAKQNGVSGGTVMLGKGTIKNRLLDLLDIGDIHKEIVMLAAQRETADHFIEKLNKEIHLAKPHHGIAFTIPILGVVGKRSCSCHTKTHGGLENVMHQAIFVIVDKGNAEAVVEAATKAGSRGGTIINARGSGIHETAKLFAMEIEPEKEIVLILSEAAKTPPIVASIRTNLKIDEPGNGIIFVQDVAETYGLY